MRSRRGYEKLPTEDKSESDNDEKVKVKSKKRKLFEKVQTHFLPEQFEGRDRGVPWKSIAYATFLFVVGTILLLCGCLIHTGHVDHQVIGINTIPYLTLSQMGGDFEIFFHRWR